MKIRCDTIEFEWLPIIPGTKAINQYTPFFEHMPQPWSQLVTNRTLNLRWKTPSIWNMQEIK